MRIYIKLFLAGECPGIKRLCENKKLATDFPPFHGAGQIFSDFISIGLDINKIVKICINIKIIIRV